LKPSGCRSAKRLHSFAFLASVTTLIALTGVSGADIEDRLDIGWARTDRCPRFDRLLAGCPSAPFAGYTNPLRGIADGRFPKGPSPAISNVGSGRTGVRGSASTRGSNGGGFARGRAIALVAGFRARSARVGRRAMDETRCPAWRVRPPIPQCHKSKFRRAR
jgi:hypothetical protein